MNPRTDPPHLDPIKGPWRFLLLGTTYESACIGQASQIHNSMMKHLCADEKGPMLTLFPEPFESGKCMCMHLYVHALWTSAAQRLDPSPSTFCTRADWNGSPISLRI